MNSDNLSLPAGWIAEPSAKPDVRYYFWKAFEDGMVVDVHVIAFRNQFRVTTQPWHDDIEPYKTVVATVATLDEALAIAYQKCSDWDAHGAKTETANKNKFKPY